MGAHTGEFANAVSAKYRMKTYAVEPYPGMLRCENERVTCIPAALGSTNGEARLHVQRYLKGSSMLHTDQIQNSFTVRSLTFQTLCAEYGIRDVSVVKMDIEGAEQYFFDTLSDEELSKIPQLTVEFHDFCGLISPERVSSIYARLERIGFMRFKCSVRNVNVLFVNTRFFSLGVVDRLRIRLEAVYFWSFEMCGKIMERLQGARSRTA